MSIDSDLSVGIMCKCDYHVWWCFEADLVSIDLGLRFIETNGNFEWEGGL